MRSTLHLTVLPEMEGVRLDRCLASAFPHISRSRMERCIANGEVRVNGETELRKGRIMRGGDQVDLPSPLETPPPPAVTGTLNLLYRDKDILVIHKPAGIAVHPGAGERRETIMDIFLKEYPEAAAMESVTPRPGIVHRLDRDTSGVLLLARNSRTLERLMNQFNHRRVQKSYLALVRGVPRIPSGCIELPLMRSRRDRRRVTVAHRPGSTGVREAVTHYTLLLRMGDCSLLRLHPETGRTHQLRVHLRHFGLPILGDPWYGSSAPAFPRLGLHAHCIRFAHPFSKAELFSCSPMPREFLDFIRSRMKSGNSSTPPGI